MKDNSKEAFWAIVRAGLWEKEIHLSLFGNIDYAEVYNLAEVQSILGLLAAGIEHVVDKKIPTEDVLTIVGSALQIEQANKEMNDAISLLMHRFQKEDIFTVLVKGQGIAQCYERPLWRASGDIDFLLDDKNYHKAKELFIKKFEQTERENPYRKHIAFSMHGIIVELHGTLRVGLSKQWDAKLDSILDDVLRLKEVRVWRNGDAEVYLPSVNYDVAIVFAHIVQHLYKGGIGLRQICDWCRLLWKYKEKIKSEVIIGHIEELGLNEEWMVLASFAVVFLGIPSEAIPGFADNPKYTNKAKRLASFVLKTGNFGKNRDLTYYQRYPYFIRKAISLNRRVTDFFSLLMIFPKHSLKFYSKTFFYGIKAVVKGE